MYPDNLYIYKCHVPSKDTQSRFSRFLWIAKTSPQFWIGCHYLALRWKEMICFWQMETFHMDSMHGSKPILKHLNQGWRRGVWSTMVYCYTYPSTWFPNFFRLSEKFYKCWIVQYVLDVSSSSAHVYCEQNF